MVGIQGIGGISGPKPERPANVRDSKQSPPAEGASMSSDGVVISSEAQAAAVVAKPLRAPQGLDEIRADRVEAAKESIERGDFKKPEIVEVVANRVSTFL